MEDKQMMIRDDLALPAHGIRMFPCLCQEAGEVPILQTSTSHLRKKRPYALDNIIPYYYTVRHECTPTYPADEF